MLVGASREHGDAPTTSASQYRQAAISHDASLAAHLRTETRLMAELNPAYASWPARSTRRATQLRPWPLAGEVARLAPRPGGAGAAVRRRARQLSAVDHSTDRRATIAAALDAYALTSGVRCG